MIENNAWLHSGPVEQYITAYPIRLITMRFILEGLGIPVPDYAKRRVGGRPPHRALKGSVIAAFREDNPKPRSMTLAPRKEGATPATVAAMQAMDITTQPLSNAERIAALVAAQRDREHSPAAPAESDDVDPLAT